MLDGGLGSDNMAGGLGDDTYVSGQRTDVLTENLNEGTDTVQSSITYALGANFENLTLTGMVAINGMGNELANIIIGNAGANLLDGAGGADDMRGGGGSDTYIVGAGDTVTESIAGAPGGVDLVKSSVTFDLGAGSNVENLTLVSGAGPIDAMGNELKNVLIGNESNNVLDGKGGADTMAGGQGHDIYTVDLVKVGTGATATVKLQDTLTEGLNNGTDTVILRGVVGDLVKATTLIVGANLEQLDASQTGATKLNLTGNTLSNTLTGNDADNLLAGLAGNDTLHGGLGNDNLAGGLGQDTVNGEAGDDQITMLVTAGNVDTINAGADTDMLVLSGVVGGNGLVVVDLSAADQVVSIAGDPTRDTQVQAGFEGVNGALLGSVMTVTGSAGDNVIIGSNGADTIDGGDGQDTLLGGGGNDTLNGGLGNDVLNGGTGNDTMAGGVGDDTYVIDNLLDVITEGAGDANDTVQINRTVDLTQAPFTEIEHVVLTGTAALNATGNSGNNQLTGNSRANVLTGGAGNDILNGGLGNDTLNGGTGDDALDGGGGNDTYVVDSALDTVTEALAGAAGGVDVVQSAVTFSLATLGNVEHLMLTGTDDIDGTGNALTNILTGNSGNNQLTGGAGNDTLVGGLGNDVLDGGAGTDRMTGGLGDDTYVRDAATDVIIEGLNAGTDTVQSALNYTLGANVENLELTGAAVIGTGNALANSLTGNSGNNTLTGLAGNDTLNGGDGNDSLDGGLGQDTVNGEAGDDQITMLVTAGNVDTIDAGAGTDLLMLSGVVGGNGLVVVDLSAADQVVSIAGDPNRDTQVQTGFEGVNGALLGSTMTVTGSNGDNLIIGSNGADTIDGGGGNDTLNGGTGNDTLNGGTGNDVLNGGVGIDNLTGGAGDDTYVIDNLLDVITEGAGDANDTVQINRSVDLTQAPFTEIEHVVLTGTAALNATGDGGNNQLTGNSGANILNGGDGNDTLTGNGGNDLLNGGSGDDTVNGGDGNDVILIGSAADHGVSEVINGGAGTDVIRFTSTTPGQTLTLAPGVTGVEGVVIGTTAGITTDTTALNVDASNVATALSIIGNAGANVLTGTSGNDAMDGDMGNDTLRGGRGNDFLDGCTGNDTYLIARGDGQDVVHEEGGTEDKILYDSGINPLDLVISRQANDLRLAIHGSSDQVTIQNWYTNAGNRVETIQAGNGDVLLSSQVDQLIQAMSAFTQQNGYASWDQAIDQNSQGVQVVLAANGW